MFATVKSFLIQPTLSLSSESPDVRDLRFCDNASNKLRRALERLRKLAFVAWDGVFCYALGTE